VEPGEVVCLIAEKGEEIEAVNINRRKGLIPRTAIEPFKAPLVG
jgi:hypothetical protein